MTVETIVLKRIPYFAGLSLTELDSIRRITVEKKVERGETIIRDGEPARFIYFVVSGVVKVYKTSADGKDQILSIVHNGDSFNDAAVLGDGLNQANVQTLVPTTIYELSKGHFENLLSAHPKMALNTIKVLAGQVRHLIDLVEDLSFRHVISRVAKILLSYSGNGNDNGARLTQQDMAALAGSAREVIGRSLKSLEEEGLIRLERHRIIIADKDALRERAETGV